MYFYLINIDNNVALYDFNDEQIEDINTIESFYKWLENNKIALITISENDLDIKGNFLPIDVSFLRKEEELNNIYQNDYIVKSYYSTNTKELKSNKNIRLFKIKLFDNQVSLEEELDNEFLPLRKEGEESFEFDDSFWDWFRQKIEYEGEPLEFIINSDREIEFDSSLNITNIEYIKDDTPKEVKIKQEEIIKKQTPLAKFFIDKIKEYKER